MVYSLLEKMAVTPSEKEVKDSSSQKIRSYLEASLAGSLSSEKFPFHNWKDHVLVVCRAVEELGKEMGLSSGELDLLQIAALFHDLGLVEGREGHEEKSAEIAERELRNFSLSDEEIDRIAAIIKGTKGRLEDNVWVSEPSSDPLVMAVRDADLVHLGRPDFLAFSEKLREEWGVKDEKEWLKKQIDFVSKHKFNTREAESMWGKEKANNLKLLKQRLDQIS